MHYLLTDIRAKFGINRPIRCQITRKKIIDTGDRLTDGRTDAPCDNNRLFFFTKKKPTKNVGSSQ